MGLSRRLFTKEFKLAAVRRLEEGVPMGEVARGLEVNPNVLHSRRSKLETPEASAKNHHRRGPQLIVVGSECPAKNGLHAEGGKKSAEIMGPLRRSDSVGPLKL